MQVPGDNRAPQFALVRASNPILLLAFLQAARKPQWVSGRGDRDLLEPVPCSAQMG